MPKNDRKERKLPKVYCPYCGPWNGNPQGSEMTLRIFGERERVGVGGWVRYYYRCIECGCKSPEMCSEEEANEAALRRYIPRGD